jgi:hypothetical protein
MQDSPSEGFLDQARRQGPEPLRAAEYHSGGTSRKWPPRHPQARRRAQLDHQSRGSVNVARASTRRIRSHVQSSQSTWPTSAPAPAGTRFVNVRRVRRDAAGRPSRIGMVTLPGGGRSVEADSRPCGDSRGAQQPHGPEQITGSTLATRRSVRPRPRPSMTTRGRGGVWPGSAAAVVPLRHVRSLVCSSISIRNETRNTTRRADIAGERHARRCQGGGRSC